MNDVAGGRVYHAWDILRELIGHDFVSGLRKLRPKRIWEVFKNLLKT